MQTFLKGRRVGYWLSEKKMKKLNFQAFADLCRQATVCADNNVATGGYISVYCTVVTVLEGYSQQSGARYIVVASTSSGVAICYKYPVLKTWVITSLNVPKWRYYCIMTSRTKCCIHHFLF